MYFVSHLFFVDFYILTLHLQGIHPGEGGIFNFPSGGDTQTGPVSSFDEQTILLESNLILNHAGPTDTHDPNLADKRGRVQQPRAPIQPTARNSGEPWLRTALQGSLSFIIETPAAPLILPTYPTHPSRPSCRSSPPRGSMSATLFSSPRQTQACMA